MTPSPAPSSRDLRSLTCLTDPPRPRRNHACRAMPAAASASDPGHACRSNPSHASPQLALRGRALPAMPARSIPGARVAPPIAASPATPATPTVSIHVIACRACPAIASRSVTYHRVPCLPFQSRPHQASARLDSPNVTCRISRRPSNPNPATPGPRLPTLTMPCPADHAGPGLRCVVSLALTSTRRDWPRDCMPAVPLAVRVEPIHFATRHPEPANPLGAEPR